MEQLQTMEQLYEATSTPEQRTAWAELVAGLPTLDSLQPFDTTGLAAMPDCKAWIPNE